jgi:hypothetical protein
VITRILKNENPTRDDLFLASRKRRPRKNDAVTICFVYDR